MYRSLRSALGADSSFVVRNTYGGGVAPSDRVRDLETAAIDRASRQLMELIEGSTHTYRMYRKAGRLHFVVGTICYSAVVGNPPGNKTQRETVVSGIQE
jgi:hypothetical protein